MLFIFALTALRALQPRRTSFSVKGVLQPWLLISWQCLVTHLVIYIHMDHLCVFLFIHVIARHSYYPAIYSYSYAAKNPQPFFCKNQCFTNSIKGMLIITVNSLNKQQFTFWYLPFTFIVMGFFLIFFFFYLLYVGSCNNGTFTFIMALGKCFAL